MFPQVLPTRLKQRSDRLNGRPAFRPFVAFCVCGFIAVSVSGWGTSGASAQVREERPVEEVAFRHSSIPNQPFTLHALDSHPDNVHEQYFSGAFGGESGGQKSRVEQEFSWYMEMFRRTWGVEDNFTIHVYNKRTLETLEVVELEDMRREYERTGRIDWDDVDEERRRVTRGIRDRWQDAGIRRSDIVVRWSRANQVREAREREKHFIEYEIAIARQLGLSLLPTEIGTVETFNEDWRVSRSGARSRYQFMPANLRRFDIHRYTIPSVSGNDVRVWEERHPLLMVEPSLTLVRAYANAVGHELPGISAYHTGPGNIFKLYEQYLRAHPSLLRASDHVSDAYMWGVTEGFERTYAVSSFGPQSRIYVLKVYGALRGMEDKTIDPEETYRLELVKVRRGREIRLSEILSALGGYAEELDWGADNQDSNLYNRFRKLNPHLIDLPLAGRRSGVPESGNLIFSRSHHRFFLPRGAVEVLRRVRENRLELIQTYERGAFEVASHEILPVDREYAELVERAGRFGFSSEAIDRLSRIASEMERLANRHPSPFRLRQQRITDIHEEVWSTRAFNDLVSTASRYLTGNPHQFRSSE